jgi:hypothetical protein
MRDQLNEISSTSREVGTWDKIKNSSDSSPPLGKLQLNISLLASGVSQYTDNLLFMSHLLTFNRRVLPTVFELYLTS